MDDNNTLYHATQMKSFGASQSKEAKKNEMERAQKVTGADIKKFKKVLSDFHIKLGDDWALPNHIKTKGDLLQYQRRLICNKLNS